MRHDNRGRLGEHLEVTLSFALSAARTMLFFGRVNAPARRTD
jgi:hypothetical protein